MGLVADGAALSQSFMLENKRPRLFAMAFCAGLILPRHGKPMRRLHYVHAVGIVALGAIHFAFQHGVMLGQIEFRVRLEMTVQARAGIFPGVYDKLPSATSNGDVFAARPMARFASRHSLRVGALEMKSRMRAGRKNACDVCVAVVASLVADKGGSFNCRWRHNGPFQAGAGDEQDTIKTSAGTCDCQRDFP